MFTVLVISAFIIIVIWAGRVNNKLVMLQKSVQELKGGVVPHTETKIVATEKAIVQPKVQAEKTEIMSQPMTTKSSEEMLLSGKPLTVVGILAVILGVGFFIKYAIDAGWLNEWSRVILGMVGGILLIVLGELWKKKYSSYAFTLSGGGIALTYFSIFASYQFYHLVPLSIAWGALFLISVLGSWLAISRKSQVLAMVSAIGAYLAPIVLFSAVDQHTGLFFYISLVNIVVVSISFYYFWSELIFLAFLGSIINLAVWGFVFLNPINDLTAAIFAGFTFLLFTVCISIALRKHYQVQTLPLKTDENIGLLFALLSIFYAATLYFSLYHSYHSYLSIMALLGSVGSFFAFAGVDRLEQKYINHALIFSGTALLALAGIWQFSGNVTYLILILVNLGLVMSGVRLKRVELRIWGTFALVAMAFAVLFKSYDQSTYVFIFNYKFLLTVLETFVLWSVGWMYSQIELTEQEKYASEASHVAGSVLLWIGFSWEIYQYFSGTKMSGIPDLLLSLWWIGYGVGLLVVGTSLKSGIYKKIAVGMFILAIAKVFLYDALNLDTSYRIISFIVLGVILLIVSYSYQKNKDRITEFLEIRH